MNQPTKILSLLTILLLGGCGLQPAQDYVTIGTLEVAPMLRATALRAASAGNETELVMTLRTSPDVKDVVVQRRWINPRFPLEFGLGKGRAEEFAGQDLYVTAELRGLSIGKILGWTPDPVPAGKYFIAMSLEYRGDQAGLREMRGYPRGGFESKAVREEAAPPGRRAMPPGPRAFSGRIEVPEDYLARLDGFSVTVQARERTDRGAPELIVRYDRAQFPLGFSLHQNHRIQATMGQFEQAMSIAAGDPILDPKFVVAQIDLDGNFDTKEDLVEAATESQVEVGASDLVLTFKAADLDRLLAAMEAGPRRPAAAEGPRNPHGTMPAAHAGTSGTRLVRGRIELPAALKDRAAGAELWLSIRDPASQKMMDAYRFQAPSFPFDFDLEIGKGMMATVLQSGQPFVLKAILAADGPMSETALIATSSNMTPGADGLVLELKTQ